MRSLEFSPPWMGAGPETKRAWISTTNAMQVWDELLYCKERAKTHGFASWSAWPSLSSANVSENILFRSKILRP